MRLAPVLPDPDLHQQRNIELNRPSISSRTRAPDGFPLGLGNVEDQFVVDLEDHRRLKPLPPKAGEDPYHGDLDEVGRGALDRGVDGVSLGEAAHRAVAAADLRDSARLPSSVVT